MNSNLKDNKFWSRWQTGNSIFPIKVIWLSISEKTLTNDLRLSIKNPAMNILHKCSAILIDKTHYPMLTVLDYSQIYDNWDSQIKDA